MSSICFLSYVKFLTCQCQSSKLWRTYITKLCYVCYVYTCALRPQENHGLNHHHRGAVELVYIGSEFEHGLNVTRLLISVSEGFSSSGLSWHYFTLKLRKQMACSHVHSMPAHKTHVMHREYAQYARNTHEFARN